MNSDDKHFFPLMCGSLAQSIVENPFVVYHQTTIKGQRMLPRKLFSGFFVRIPGGFIRKSCENFAFVNAPTTSGHLSAIFSAICSSPIVCPLKVIEKRKRSGISVSDSLRFPSTMFRGIGLVAFHSSLSTTLRLVEQPRLKRMLGESSLASSLLISTAYIVVTNPLSRLEIIIQTGPMNLETIRTRDALRLISRDISVNGCLGMFRGQGISLLGATISLFTFHEVKNLVENSAKMTFFREILSL